MDRRGDEARKRLLLGGLIGLGALAVFVIAISVLFWSGRGSSDTLELPSLPSVSTIEPDGARPVPTVSDFYPEDSNLSDCIGLVERPGCGSEARGGWRQTLVFVALAAGMALIFWRISVGVRRNRSTPPTDAHTPGPDPDESRV